MNETSYGVESSLTFKKGNSKNVLSFSVNYKATGKQYGNIEINGLTLSGKKFDVDKLPKEAIEKITNYAGCSRHESVNTKGM